MTEVKPFRAIHYNQEKVGDLSRVVCPPYDVISKEQQDAYYRESKYNFIRVLLGKDTPKDDRRDNKYTRAKQTFEKWIQEGVLLQDEKPCIYCYQEEYRILGERHSRVGFIGLLRLQDEENSGIFPHEHTHTRAREDRLRLWRTVSSNLSPIFVCFSDKEKRLGRIFEKDIAGEEPFIDIFDNEKVRHTVWRLDDPELIRQVVGVLSRQQLFIADGHHRYEVAMEYRKAKLSGRAKVDGRDPCNYVMTYFTNMDSKDLKIFPMHRIVKDFPKDLGFLNEFFRIDKITAKDNLVLLLARAGRHEHAFGLYMKDGTRLLRLKNKWLVDKHILKGSKAYRRLDATILKHFVFDPIDIKSDDILYTRDIREATALVDKRKARAAFIMNPVSVQHLKEIALNGERMPPKTTYFYPKVLSGLTVYRIG